MISKEDAREAIETFLSDRGVRGGQFAILERPLRVHFLVPDRVGMKQIDIKLKQSWGERRFRMELESAFRQALG